MSLSPKRHFFLKNLLLVLMGILCCVPIAMVLIQYVYLRDAISQLREYQDEYRSYAMALKRMMRNKTKTVSEEATSDSKKKIDEQELGIFDLPADKEVFSSDCDEPIFRVVNRDKKRLRLEALAYARKHKLESALLQLYQEPAYPSAVKKKKKIARHKKRRKKKKVARAIQGIPLQMVNLMTDEKELVGKLDFTCEHPLKPGTYRLSSSFGPRKLAKRGWRFHCGVDFAAAPGTPIYAAAAGTIVQAGWYRGYGNCITIAHGKKYRTRYGHMKQVTLQVGTKVSAGTLIGYVSNTGLVSGKNGYHLHFEVHSFGKPINPMLFLKR